jgi:hypothetical protein
MRVRFEAKFIETDIVAIVEYPILSFDVLLLKYDKLNLLSCQSTLAKITTWTASRPTVGSQKQSKSCHKNALASSSKRNLVLNYIELALMLIEFRDSMPSIFIQKHAQNIVTTHWI